jgi:hypothetical protein
MNKTYNNFPSILKDFLFCSTLGKMMDGGVFAGKSFVGKINPTKNIKISLTTNGTHNHFEGFNVEIIDIEKGILSFLYFPFKQYLVSNYKSNINNNYVCNHLWVIGDIIEWYDCLPTNESSIQMMSEIDKYIKLWV